MSIKKLLLATVALYALPIYVAYAQPAGQTPATVFGPTNKDQCAKWLETGQNAVYSAACGGTATPGGTNGQVQINSAGALGGINTTGSGSAVLNNTPTIASPNLTGTVTTPITGSTQCLQANTSGVLSGTGSACGGAGSTPGGSTNDIQYNAGGTFGGRTPQGNGTKVQMFSGTTPATNDCAKFDANGNVTTAGAACGSGGGAVSSVSSNSQNLIITPTTGAVVASTTYPGRTITGTDTVLSTDMGGLLTFNSATAFTETLPTVGTTGFGSGATFDVSNINAGTATINSTSGSFNLAVPQYMGCTIRSNGTTYETAMCSALVPYDIGVNYSGVLANSAKYTFKANRAFQLPVSLAGSQAVIGTNPTATLAVTINKNGSSIGSISFSTSGTPTITFASAVTFAVGDILTLVGPGTADTTGADIGITLAGTRK